MARKIITVSSDTPIEEVCRILTKNNLSGVPVVNKSKKLVGFISEKDIIANYTRSFGKKTRDIMNKNVTYIKYGTPLDKASEIFTDKTFRHLPVVKNGKVVDVISRKDVISRLVGHYY